MRYARRGGRLSKEQRCWVIDIEGFFDNRDHDVLMRHLAPWQEFGGVVLPVVCGDVQQI